MNDHPSPRRMRVTPIGELGCQNETRGGGGSTCAWRTLSTHFKPRASFSRSALASPSHAMNLGADLTLKFINQVFL